MQQNLIQLSGVDLVVPTHGLEGAKAYPLGVNSRVPLFDDTEDVFYIKSTDANGFPTVKKYRFSEEVVIDPNNNGNGIALQDIRNLIREELATVKEELVNAKQSVSTANHTEAKSNDSSKSSVVKQSPNAKHRSEQQQRTNTSNVELSQVQQQPSTDV